MNSLEIEVFALLAVAATVIGFVIGWIAYSE